MEEDNLDVLLSMFQDEREPSREDNNLDDLFDNDSDCEDGDGGYVEPEEGGKDEENADDPTQENNKDVPDSSRGDLEAELRRMQEKMRELQQQLIASQTSSKPSSPKLGPASFQSPPKSSPSIPPSTVLSPPTQKSSKSTLSTSVSSTSKLKTAGVLSQKPSQVVKTDGLSQPARDALRSPPPYAAVPPVTRKDTPRPSVRQDVAVEKFSGLRLRKPRLSSIDIEHKMADRRMIRLSQLPERVTREKLEDSDWVTFAVLVNKITPQSKSNGKTFSIWKLNDLHNLEVYVSLFLFGNVHIDLWKTDTGTVIGILNPNVMKNKEGSNELSLTIDHPQKVLILGEAMDFGTCKASKKSGEPCSQLVNLFECQYCQYHVKAQYKKMSSKRAELQSSFSGTAPKRGRGRGSLRERLCQGDFHYGGVSSLACAASVSGPKPKKNNQSTLTGVFIRDHAAAMPHKLVLKSEEVDGCSDDFKSLLSMPTPGALNIKRHLGQAKAKDPAGPLIQSISASELLKQQKAQHKERILNRQKRAEEIQKRVLQNSGKSTPLVRPTPCPSDPATPTLGRGFCEGDDIVLDLSPPPPSSSISVAKLAALRRLQSKGVSITKEDPNAVKRKRSNGTEISARVEKNRTSPEGGSATEEGEEPVQKRRREQMEYIQSEEFQRILNAKSQFSWLMGEMEVKAMQDYFEPLVQKEKLEEKMKSIREQKCRAVTCKTCKYTHFKPADRCVEEKHDYHWHDAHKRFFKCPCGQRKISLARFPCSPCSNCGLFKWERDGMLKASTFVALACGYVIVFVVFYIYFYISFTSGKEWS
ncbi:protein MCM10 homolog isoform X2 [Denticeps clupeoides]|uniref:protein MCM10 homolog isoform X2 n=1 Tax=Denticeps clupeoides TaxID=299321 RepID=UPI0010A3791F|nr:protein MCM10 homolog isoform X2 [Denticeps clupeoides]